MELALYITASIALLALAGLFIYLTILLSRIRPLIDTATRGVQDLVGEVQQTRIAVGVVVENLAGVAKQAEGTVARLNTQLENIEGIVVSASDISRDVTEVVDSAKQVVVSVLDLEQNIQRKVQAPVLEILNLLTALSRGIRAFRVRLAGGGNGNDYAAQLRE